MTSTTGLRETLEPKALEAAKAVEDDMRWMAADRHSDIQPLVRERLIEGADMIERFRSALSRRVPASGELDRRKLVERLARNLAVAYVDARHGYTMEFAPSPAAHRDEYDECERWTRIVLDTEFLVNSRDADALASLPLPVAGTPKGWRLVPEEPTLEMIDKGQWQSNHYPCVPKGWSEPPLNRLSVTQIYRAMLAAAPPAAEPVAGLPALIRTTIRDCCEWDDRTSPEGYEEYMFFTPEELSALLEHFASKARALSTPPSAPHE